MKKTSCKYTRLGCAVVFGTIISHGQLALAGWSGAMNGIGYGSASVSVHAFDTASGKTKRATTPNMQNPSAAITFTEGYVYGNDLPDEASPATEAKVIGFPGYIWQANVVGSDGDDTGNAELENRVTIIAADCASLTMASSAVIDTNKKSGTITINVHATAGTALWSRGWECPLVPPPDDPTTDVNETVEFLKAHGSLKWDHVNLGPMDQNTNNCNALQIPFSYDTDPTNLYFVSDGVAKSLPLVIQCPNDIVVDCQQPVKFPETVLIGGCGNITVSFDPPAPNPDGSFPVGYFPVGVTPVRVSATDTNGNTTNCTFKVIVTDTTAPTIPSLATVTGACGAPVTVTVPTATDNCAGTVTGTTSDPLTYTTPGTYIVHWKFGDGNGNTNTANQTVIVAGLTLQGFYSPIGTISNLCGSTTVIANKGNNIPIKFDVGCGTSIITSGLAPIVKIEEYDPSCAGPLGNVTAPAVYQNDWHANWDTNPTRKNYKYRISVTVNGVELGYVWVKIK